nr:MAG TPA: hypothetical protein [Caudoviricetes sp.]DAS39370.1 MAG TPA: hypothetical protein [Caudoviricetes sp.]
MCQLFISKSDLTTLNICIITFLNFYSTAVVR